MSYLATTGHNPRRGIPKPSPVPTTETGGVIESELLELQPAVLLTLAETSGTTFSDLSGNSRSGTLNGSGATLGVTALASNVAGANKAVNLGGSAWISVAHAAADIALTTSYASPWDGDHTNNRFVADCTAALWFKPNALPTGSNKAVILAKSANQTPGVAASYAETTPISATAGSTVAGGSLEAYLDSAGAVHVEVRSFRGRPCRIRTADGAVSVGGTYHLTVQLGYNGVTAWLNGAQFEDGYPNRLHVYGLAADIRGVLFANTYDWTIGKAAWGGQANLVVDEFAIFLRKPDDTIDQSEVNILAQQGASPAPLAHHIWGASSQAASGSVTNINSAINSRNAAGGGTVLISPGTYSGNITMKSNVRIKANGGTVTLNGRILTPSISLTSLGIGTGTLAVGGKTLTVNNSRSVGDVVRVMGLNNGPNGAATSRRHDRRWNSLAQSIHPDISDGELFMVESRTSTSLTFVGAGSVYGFPQSERQSVHAYTPHTYIGIEDITVNSSSGAPVLIDYAVNCRLVNVNATATGGQDNAVNFRELCMFSTIQGGTLTCHAVQPTHPSTLDFTRGSTDCVAYDITIDGEGHAVDVGTNANYPPNLRCEFHEITSIQGTTNNLGDSKYGAHGDSTDNIHWNIDVNRGGYNVTGWKHDTRWTRQGLNSQGTGLLGANDGMGDCWIRDTWHVNPRMWFGTHQGTQGCQRCHFENIKRSAAPTTYYGGSRDLHDFTYGTGANVNTYSNVDGPHASWSQV